MLRLSRNLKIPNHFQILNLQEKFKIDEKLLKKNFLKLQREHHPDKLASSSSPSSSSSSSSVTITSSDINKAYKCLKTPIERGLYLIKLKDSSKDLSELNIISNTDFLLDIYEFNEEFDEAIQDKNVEIFEKLFLENEEKRKILIDEIEELFGRRELEKCFEKLAELKYYESIKDRAFESEMMTEI